MLSPSSHGGEGLLFDKESGMTWEVVAAGFVVGVMIGLTGMGGGSLITPIMIFGFGVPPQIAVGTDLVLGALTKLAGAVTHVRLGNVNFRLTGLLLSGSLPGALLGLLVLKELPSWNIIAVDSVITHTLGIVLLAVSISLLFPAVWRRAARWKSSPDAHEHPWIIRGMSFGTGFVVALSSVGSGSLLVPFMLATVSLPLSRIVGIDVVHGAVLTAVAGAGHLANGTVDFPLLSSLLVGSLPGAVLGSRLSVAFPRRGLEIVLASLLAASGFRLL